MLIGCITGSDFETAKSQIEMANLLCDGIELRLDLIETEMAPLMALASGKILLTKADISKTLDGKTISTYHNFDETPEDLEEILKGMPEADFYKISTMANRTTDSLRMLAFVKKHKNVAGMCMGALGQATRILAPIFGNPLTFSALGKEAAPGQLQAQELVETYHFHELGGSTQIYGLIGNPVNQSPSHKTHNAYFRREGIDAVYVKFQLLEEELPLFFSLAKEIGIRGLSVTAPFKEKLFPYIDVVEEEAKAIGAINTLTFEERIYGANTDASAALDALERRGAVAGKRCVVLGAGGASKAIVYEARKRGAEVEVLSRRYGNLDHLGSYDILVNTTPVDAPMDLGKLLPGKIVMDINHGKSALMKRAEALGCTLIDSKEMFELQAAGQFSRWAHSLFA